MGRISVGEAVSAGFRLIGREPLAFLAWCMVFYLVSGLPQALMLSATLPMLSALGAAGGNALDPAVQAANAEVLRYQPVNYLSALALLFIVPPAIFRAVLRPDDRQFLYLRIGAREAWSLLVSVVLIVMWVISLFAVMIPVGIILGVSAVASRGNPAASAMALLFIPAFAVTVWGVLRFSMAPVMSFADRTFRLPESWNLTRGHAWRMFLVALAIFAITVFAELVIVAIGFGAGAMSGGFGGLAGSWAKDPFGAMSRISLVWILLGLFVLSTLSSFVYVLWMAAWADIYRQLKPPLAETFS